MISDDQKVLSRLGVSFVLMVTPHEDTAISLKRRQKRRCFVSEFPLNGVRSWSMAITYLKKQAEGEKRLPGA